MLAPRPMPRRFLLAMGGAAAGILAAPAATALAQDAPPPPPPPRIIAPVDASGVVEIREGQPTVWSTAPMVVEGAITELNAGPFGGMPFMAPDLLDVNEILRPDFRMRDLPTLIAALELDADQSVILESLLRDYTDAHTTLADACQDVIRRYRSIRRSERMLDAISGDGLLSRLNLGAGENHVVVLDGDDAGGPGAGAVIIAQSIRIDGSGSDGDEAETATPDDPAAMEARRRAAMEALREARAAMEVEFEELTRTMLERIESLRAEGEATAEDVQSAANTLHTARQALRAELISLLHAIVNPSGTSETADADIQRALDHVLIADRIATGRLGGESIDLRAAASAAGHPDRGDANIATEYDATIAGSIRLRSQAIIDRELAGLAALVRRDAVDAETTEGESPDYTKAMPALNHWADRGMAEVTTHVALRDIVLGAVESAVDHVEPTLFARWRDEAMQRGFPRESRPRWAERAVTAALAIEGLTPEQLEAVQAIDVDVTVAAAALRAEAIAKRITDDPERLRDQWESAAERISGGRISFAHELNQDGDLRTRQRELDKTTEVRLAAALGDVLAKTLPRRNVRTINIGGREIDIQMPNMEGAADAIGIELDVLDNAIDQAMDQATQQGAGGAIFDVIRGATGGSGGDGDGSDDGSDDDQD
ncbi:MAG: hypothetical protein AB8G96_08055 [Phycisphaerales bacterium]